MNDKAKAFESYLKQEHIHCFRKEERNDKLHTVLYKTHIDCEDQKLPVFVVLDDSAFSYIRIALTTMPVAKTRQKEVLVKLNKLNDGYKVSKYYISSYDDVLYMDMSVPCLPKTFDSSLVLHLISGIAIPHLEEMYRSIMSIVMTKAQAAKAKAQRDAEKSQAAESTEQGGKPKAKGRKPRK